MRNILLKHLLRLKSHNSSASCLNRFYSTQIAVQTETSPTLTADVLLTDSYQKRVLECMTKSPPVGVKLKNNEVERKYAAVLILLCTKKANDEQNEEVSLLYTRRSGHLNRHVRQICFPGGIRDDTDVDFVDCALRETMEEIGLDRSRIQIWGPTSLITPPHTAAIMPVVGVCRNFDLNELKLNEHEVEEAFTVPVSELAKPSTLQYTQFKSGFSSPTFVIGRKKIWGVTGFITNSFMNCLLPRELNQLKGRVKFIRPYKPASN
ncbi:nucleoside diphosphate-linked moiety X motif 8 [Teleopsis dalmanni]|uniref:nucleoside diphosphate-linked moiety X motif 8 n=1 Tax=Teleopsis dalmanni TaxID=139649 RepID=UPI0018CDA3CB|nr:nucleoside diphosphate-linked moiety X motif 8 [Teleopsis dalmanni]